MNQQTYEVEVLDSAQRGEAIDVLTSAFRNYPMLPSGLDEKQSRLMTTTFLDTFADAPEATLFGIRCNQKLASVAFVFAYGYQPGIVKFGLFIWRLLRIIGFQNFRLLTRLLSEEHNGSDRRLELMLLGTNSEFQGQGLGRKLLRHIIGFARDNGYDAVVLETGQQTPAFSLYQSEGFVQEKELLFPTMEMPMSMMRRETAENSLPQ